MRLIKEDWEMYLMMHQIEGEKLDYVVIDPPWFLNDRPPRLCGQLDYSRWEDNVECLKEVFELDVDHFLIWTINSILPDVFRAIAETDDITYKTLYTWWKQTKHGKVFFGIGNTMRSSTEQIVIASRKGKKPMRLQIRNSGTAKARERTGKPRNLEIEILTEMAKKGFQGGVYLFSGNTELDVFKEFDIDLVDIALEREDG